MFIVSNNIIYFWHSTINHPVTPARPLEFCRRSLETSSSARHRLCAQMRTTRAHIRFCSPRLTRRPTVSTARSFPEYLSFAAAKSRIEVLHGKRASPHRRSRARLIDCFKKSVLNQFFYSHTRKITPHLARGEFDAWLIAMIRFYAFDWRTRRPREIRNDVRKKQ